MDAVILLSGGLDSATAAAVAKAQGHVLHALTVDYGQRHAREIEAARAVGRWLGAKDHKLVSVDLRAIGGSALTDDIPVPKGRGAAEMARGIPATYVPARNTILLALGLACCEAVGGGAVYIGVNALDYSGYPDCRPEFIEAFRRVAETGTKAGAQGRRISIEAPLLRMTKAEIILKGVSLGLDYSLTFSCYDPVPGGLACGRCDACMLRLKGFREAGMEDPAAYAPGARLPS